MAPPITVDIMAFLLCRKNIARGKPQQGDRCRRRAALALPMPLQSRYGLQRDTSAQSKVWWNARSKLKNYSAPRLSTLQKSDNEAALSHAAA